MLDRAFSALAAKVIANRFLIFSQKLPERRMPSSKRPSAALATCTEMAGGAVWRASHRADPESAWGPPIPALQSACRLGKWTEP